MERLTIVDLPATSPALGYWLTRLLPTSREGWQAEPTLQKKVCSDRLTEQIEKSRFLKSACPRSASGHTHYIQLKPNSSVQRSTV